LLLNTFKFSKKYLKFGILDVVKLF